MRTKMVAVVAIVLVAAVVLGLGEKTFSQPEEVSKERKLVPALSPSAMMALESFKRNDTTARTFTKAAYLSRMLTGNYVCGMLLVDPMVISPADLSNHGILVESQIEDIWTVRVPLGKVETASTLRGVRYFEADMPITSKLDTALLLSKASATILNSVNPNRFTGKGVVVGVVDSGFDYSHPSFKDSLGKSRIKFVWDQTMVGSRPLNFSYGNELSGDSDYAKIKTDSQFGTHGTHVLGICAGGAFGKPYVGIAPQSDIILVAYLNPLVNEEYMSTSLSGVLDGVNYIFKRAEAMGQPAVVNLSLGFHMGPHDGTSLFDQACDKLVGRGRILVGAAGNEGLRAVHLGLNFTASDTVFRTFAASRDETFSSIDSWGEVGKNYCVEVSSFSKARLTDAGKMTRVCSNDNKFVSATITGSDGLPTSVSIYAVAASPINQRPRITIYADKRSKDLLKLSVFSKNKEPQKVNFWNDAYGYSSNFTNSDLAGYVNGDSNCSMGELGGTGKRIVSVGAYTTRNYYKSLSGTQRQKISYFSPVGDIAPFSSKGPTVDGRIKPDIVAPGNVVVSSLNSCNTSFGISSPSTIMAKNDNGRQYVFGVLQGTSMSAPMVAGTVALLLQQDPTLTPEQVKYHLAQGALIDQQTGLTGAAKSNVWGSGKLSAAGALTSLIGKNVNPPTISTNDLFLCTVYDTRLDGTISITAKVDDEIKLNIFDMSGKMVYVDKFRTHKLLQLSSFKNGVYVIKGFTNTKSASSKIIIKK